MTLAQRLLLLGMDAAALLRIRRLHTACAALYALSLGDDDARYGRQPL